MINLLLWIGRIAGMLGVLMAVGALAARAMGQWHIGSLSAGTLLQGGVAVMIIGVLAYVTAFAERGR